LISPRVLVAVENAVKVEPVVEFELKGIVAAFGGLRPSRRCRFIGLSLLAQFRERRLDPSEDGVRQKGERIRFGGRRI
jgi:hypothetical protein